VFITQIKHLRFDVLAFLAGLSYLFKGAYNFLQFNIGIHTCQVISLTNIS